ncbi:MAG TPA: alkaline phosphatase D family protein, partial [Burkholderiaceae bacterium]|nr:alkaline phosphatase D family protein [Burkholderiaceae bacterium]
PWSLNMSRPAPRPPRVPTRRDFFRRSGSAALAAAALPLLPIAGRAAGPVFQHGVASGDPLADRVIVWTRATPPDAGTTSVTVDYVVATDAALTQVVRSGRLRTNANRDFTVKVDVGGLDAARSYYYRFAALGATSPVGRTRTLPTSATSHLRIAVASCGSHAAGYFNAYRRIAERADLDLVLHLGDYLYEYGSNEFGTTRATEPPTEAITLTDYRTRHAQYKRDADLQELHRQHVIAPIWDDHEVANDAWRNGAENHDAATEGQWSARRNAALQAYYEWMPVREPAVRTQPQRSLRLGDLAEIVLLEERHSARSKQLPAPIPVPGVGQGFKATGRFLDPARTLLGTAQEAWLGQVLAASTARWKLIGQGVMLAQLKALGKPNADGGSIFVNPDQWDGYPPARDRLHDQIAASGNVVVLTGDIHSAWANDITRDPNNASVAGGGYDPATGQGAIGVEFVATSITSPGIPDPDGSLAGLVRSQNPHVKHVDLERHGYLLLDLTSERVVGEYWNVDTVAAPSSAQSFAIAFEVRDGVPHLVPSAQTAASVNPPAKAP